MNVLVVGSGGREHALVWKLAQSDKVKRIFCAPGNDGMEGLAERVPIHAEDVDGLVQFAKENGIGLTVVGPEAPLMAGIVDRFEAEGLKIFGPRQDAARIEGSKRFAKELMQKHGIPTAAFRSFADAEAAKAYVREKGAPIVIKADGLAAGKGVVVAFTVEEAEKAITAAMEEGVFGEAGREVVIEEYLDGQEISLMAFLDGNTVKPMVPAQDHKAVFDGDHGPNTGGMGAYSPVPQIPQSVVDEAIRRILLPMSEVFRREGIEYKGVLYAGLMVTKDGPKVIEFNARFGDPETQAVLPRLQSDLAEICLAVAEGRLSEVEIAWREEAAVCVVMAAGGYPGTYEKGKEIHHLPEEQMDRVVFHAGTRRVDDKWFTAGGRVLGVTALGRNVVEARERAYEWVQQIEFEGAHYRTDIAFRALGGK
jgi:phosphoribosylamine--glycine ligase